jgi:hypothetical protein
MWDWLTTAMMSPERPMRSEGRTQVSESEREKHISIHHEDEQEKDVAEEVEQDDAHDDDAPSEAESSDA